MSNTTKIKDMPAQWCRHNFHFVFDAQTSRGHMTDKRSYFIRLLSGNGTPVYAEVPLFEGLSAEDTPEFEQHLAEACLDPRSAETSEYSSIAFGFEAARRRMKSSFADNEWLKGNYGIDINGLIWMADRYTMAERIARKLDEGYRVIKLKIGGINFEDELALISDMRHRFPAYLLEIRLDANGSFHPAEAAERLKRLSAFDIHSIEQPVAAGQPELMAALCRNSPIPIALDEELIGVRTTEESRALLQTIRPQYIILKPALCGGFTRADVYINAARELDIGWWATSALESNIGLFDIAHWLTDNYGISMPQGLGTGLLYSNNIESPLELRGTKLFCNPSKKWQSLEDLPWHN